MLGQCEAVHPDSLCIVMPAYNEEQNIRKVVEDWYRVVAEHNPDGSSRLIVVNDGSTDGTQRVLHAMAYTHPLLRVIDKPNGGHGSAVIRGYQEAVRIGADYVFQTDSDGQTMPSNFDKFWRWRHRYDAQFGWRKHRGDGIGRAMAEHVLCALLWLFFGVPVPDANAPFRLMKSWHLKQYLERLLRARPLARPVRAGHLPVPPARCEYYERPKTLPDWMAVAEGLCCLPQGHETAGQGCRRNGGTSFRAGSENLRR